MTKRFWELLGLPSVSFRYSLKFSHSSIDPRPFFSQLFSSPSIVGHDKNPTNLISTFLSFFQTKFHSHHNFYILQSLFLCQLFFSFSLSFPFIFQCNFQTNFHSHFHFHFHFHVYNVQSHAYLYSNVHFQHFPVLQHTSGVLPQPISFTNTARCEIVLTSKKLDTNISCSMTFAQCPVFSLFLNMILNLSHS